MARPNKHVKLKGVEDIDLMDVAGGGRDPEGQHSTPRRAEVPLECRTTGEDVTLLSDTNVTTRNV